jgi:hypothetical protein
MGMNTCDGRAMKGKDLDLPACCTEKDVSFGEDEAF